jgi:hypothetical protein
MSNIFKIYGLRTSGTNWLQWLIESNIKDSVVLRNQLAWKHGNPTNTIDWSGVQIEWDDKASLGNEYFQILESWKSEKLSNTKTILEMKEEIEQKFNSGNIIHCFIVKHPYSWMDSRINKRKKDLNTEITDWNERIKSYFNFEYPSKVIISYEKLNMNPKSIIESISNQFGLSMADEFKDTEKNLTHGFDVNGIRTKLDVDYTKYFKSKFDKNTIQKIDSLLDTESLKLYNTL